MQWWAEKGMDGVFDGTKVPSGRRGYDLEVGYKLDLFCSLHIGRRVQVYGFGCDGNVILYPML